MYEIKAKPGQHIRDFFVDMIAISTTLGTAVYATFNDTTIDVTPTDDLRSVGGRYEERRNQSFR